MGNEDGVITVGRTRLHLLKRPLTDTVPVLREKFCTMDLEILATEILGVN